MRRLIILVCVLVIFIGCAVEEPAEVKETPSEITPSPGTELPEPLEPTETEEEIMEEEEPEEEPEEKEETSGELEAGGGKKIAYIWIKREEYDPAELNITKGTKVVWINDNSVAHIFKQIGKGFRSPIIKVGETFEHTFNESEVFRYADLSFGMKGTINIE
tara:strand:+ start:10533 stop:11015 length:483 start_codon:yes stop_codon:yes gene_type:complete